MDDWREIFDAIPYGVSIHSPQSEILDANITICNILGKKREDIVGKKCYKIFHNKDAPPLFCPLEKSKISKKREASEAFEPALKAWLSVVSTPILSKDGNVEKIIHTIRDISKEKNAEETLKDSEIKYRSIYDYSGEALMLTVPGKGFISGNPATLKMFGCKDEREFISHKPASLSPEYQPDGTLSSIKAEEMMRIAMEKGSHFFEWVHKRVDGKEFYATVLLTKMELRSEKILQAIVRDITDLKEAESELKKKINDLERFQRVSVDRELKMKELKAKITELKARSSEGIKE